MEPRVDFAVFCVVGSKGSGKSYLCNKLWKTNFEQNAHAQHVTLQQQEQLRDGLTIVDTVGMDANKNNFLDLHQHKQKRVCLIFLNNDLRVRTSLELIASQLEVASHHINVYNTYSFKQQPEDMPVAQYEDIFIDFANGQFKTFVYTPTKLPPNPSPKPKEPPTPTTQKKKPPKVKAPPPDPFKPFPMLQSGMFVNLATFSSKKINCREAVTYLLGKLTLPKIKAYRKLGDSLVHYFALQYLHHNQLDVEQYSFVTNVRMKDFLAVYVTQPQLLRLYDGTADRLSDEKCADVFEAMIYLSFSQERQFFMVLLNAYLDFCK